MLKEIIERIYSSIQFIKNFSNNEFTKYSKLITTLTISVTSRIDEINGKFVKLAESSKKRIQNQIYINKSNSYLSYLFLLNFPKIFRNLFRWKFFRNWRKKGGHDFNN